MSRNEGAFGQLESYFEEMLGDISPARKRAVARKVGQQLRRSNLARIAENVEPDGSDMEPRKPRRELRGGRKRRRKKMFGKLRYARHYRIRASADGVQVAPKKGAAAIARVHHFGLRGYVGETRVGRKIRTKYAERRLLGFGSEDLDAMTDELLAWLDRR